MSLELVSVALAALALLVAVWAILAARRVGNSQKDLQQRLLSLELAREADRLAQAKRAQLRARIVKEPEHAYYMVIKNEGLSEARAMSVTVDRISLGEHESVPAGEFGLIRTLGAGAEARYRLHVYMGSPPVFDVTLRWEDDTAEPGFWRSELRWL